MIHPTTCKTAGKYMGRFQQLHNPSGTNPVLISIHYCKECGSYTIEDYTTWVNNEVKKRVDRNKKKAKAKK